MQTHERMVHRWFALWRRLGVKSPDDDLWILRHFYRLMERYGEPHRAYHTLDHIEHCLDKLLLARTEAQNLDSVELAIWFHDVVYHTHKHPKDAPSNEALSAAYARDVIRKARLNEDLQDLVDALVMVTLHRPGGAKTQDEMLLADIDWSPLGWNWEQFVENGKQIRHEYGQYSDADFKAGRLSALQWMRNRDSQFYLPRFKHKYEEAAKRNIERAIAELST